MVVFNLYPRLARTQIGESLKKMNSFRSAALLDGKAAPHSTAEYRSLVATAASLTSALTTPQNILFHLERLSAFSEAALKDPKYDPRTLSKYDTRQDRWWYGGEKAEREFIDSLRIVALHVLHGEASSPEDFFHIFQMLKCLRESDPKERNIPDFLMPAYGGILLPDSFEGTTRNGLLGRLLLYLTEINSLVPLDAEGLILNLNWFPEDGEEGLKEMQLVLDAAELLGYSAVQFILPSAYEYKELFPAYKGLMQIEAIEESHDQKGTIIIPSRFTRVHNQNFSKIEGLEPWNSEPISTDSLHSVTSVQDVGFATRLLVAFERLEKWDIRLGIFSPLDVTDVEKLAQAWMKKAHTSLSTVQNGFEDAMSSVQDLFSQFAERLSAQFAFLKSCPLDSELAPFNEQSLELVESEPKWRDLQRPEGAEDEH